MSFAALLSRAHCCLTEPLPHNRIGLTPSLGGQTMRWKISHHDARRVDLIAAVALVILIVAAWKFFEGGSSTPSTASFIVPSQSVHW